MAVQAALAAVAGGAAYAVAVQFPLGHWLVFVVLLAAVPLLTAATAARRWPRLGFFGGGISAAVGVALVEGFRSSSGDGQEIGAANAFWEGVLVGSLPALVAVVVVGLIWRRTSSP